MKKIIFFTFFYLASILQGSYVLGTSNHKIPKDSKNYKYSVIFSYNNSKWSASKPLSKLPSLQKSNKLLLLNNNNIDYKASIYTKDSYHFKKGWNSFSTTKNGLDVLQTFQKAYNVSFIFVYDKISAVWAGFSPNKEILAQMMSTRILYLKYIEPNKKFFLYAKSEGSIKIKSLKINKVCQKVISSSKYKTLRDSGNDSIMSYSNDKSIGVKSRYFSHYKRGIYSDSRIILIYPKLEKTKNRNKKGKYGPIKPKVLINYSKEYENRYFYIYDYYEKSCFKGIFPSIKIPPFATLQKVSK